jgi:hypothetical protein
MAGFLITGEFVAQHGRDRVYEFGWEDGVRFLASALPGMPYADAVEVLAGRKTFAGDSNTGLTLVDESSELRKQTEDQHRWLYAGVMYDRPSKKYWRPYAYVCGWGPQDMRPNRIENRYHPYPSGRMVSERCGGDMASWGRFRNVYYMDDPVEDRMWYAAIPGRLKADGDQAVLFKNVPSPPMWWMHLTDPRLAVVEYVRAGYELDERGAHKERLRESELKEIMGEIKLPKGPPPKAVIANPPGPPPNASRIQELIAESGQEDYVKDGLLRALTDDGAYRLPDPTTDVTQSKWAWVDRGGKLWPCRGYMDHIPMAQALCEKFQVDAGPYKGNWARALEAAGWGKVGVSNLGDPYGEYRSGLRRTKALTEKIAEWLMHHAKQNPDQLARWLERADGFDY